MTYQLLSKEVAISLGHIAAYVENLTTVTLEFLETSERSTIEAQPSMSAELYVVP